MNALRTLGFLLFISLLGAGCLAADEKEIDPGIQKVSLESRIASYENLPDSLKAEKVIDEYISMAVNGDIRAAKTLLYENRLLSEKLGKLSNGYQTRFVEIETSYAVPPEGYFVAEVINDYKRYWRSVLLKETNNKKAESKLKSDLKKTLAERKIRSWGNPMSRVKKELEENGLHVLGGTTSPYKELMIWRRQKETPFEIDLTDGTQKLTVVFLHDFIVSGWVDYATLGQTGSSGWAKSDKIYLVADRYDLDSESFEVSYLKHEARHYADYKLFPKLDSFGLEYRAKLSELIYAEESLMDLVENFHSGAVQNSESPHPKANHKLISEISRRIFQNSFESNITKWKSIDVSLIKEAARELLIENTSELSN